MKKTLYAAASAAALFAFAAPAAAAPVSGGRVEAIVGYDAVDATLDDGTNDFDFDQSGIVFGVGVGYDFAVGENSALGIDLEASTTTADASVTDTGVTGEIDPGRDLYAGVRFTTGLSDNVNLFVGAGYTNQRITATVTAGNVTEEESANADGVRGRLGLQFGFGSNAYATIEYRYSNYEADLTRHQAVGGIGFRF